MVYSFSEYKTSIDSEHILKLKKSALRQLASDKASDDLYILSKFDSTKCAISAARNPRAHVSRERLQIIYDY